MTLILTELSATGIAMATDSAISVVKNGKLSSKDQQEWKKLLRVPRIKGAISYWGWIGLISKRQRFDEWLEHRIKNGSYRDVASLADYLADELNQAVNNEVLAQPVGLHVTGYAKWADGVSRPILYHVHNGHGLARVGRLVQKDDGKILRTTIEDELDPRELFSRHNDFSPESINATKFIELLNSGNAHFTRNGEYGRFSLIQEELNALFETLNTAGISIPKNPHTLGGRVGHLKALLEISIEIYKCSSLQRTVGGKVLTLGIKPHGHYLIS